jgi:hypothetical protein
MKGKQPTFTDTWVNGGGGADDGEAEVEGDEELVELACLPGRLRRSARTKCNKNLGVVDKHQDSADEGHEVQRDRRHNQA